MDMENEKPSEELFSESTETPVSNTVETKNDLKKKSKLKVIIAIVIILLIIILAAGYFFFLTKPKEIFDRKIQESVNYLTENIDKQINYNTLKEEGTISYEISSSDNTIQEMFELFNGITLNYNVQIDYSNKLINADINTNFNEEKLIDFNLYTENQKGYILLKDVYDRYISTNIEGYNELFTTKENAKDVKVIINSISKALMLSLENDDFTKEDATIEVNNKNINVKKQTLVIDQNNIKRISENILNTLKDDNEFIDSMNNIIEDENTDIKTLLENAITQLNEQENFGDEKVEISLYTKGILNKVLKTEIEFTSNDIPTTIAITENDENNYNYTVEQNSITLVTGTIKIESNTESKLSEGQIEVTANISNIIDLKINIDNKVEYDVDFEKADVSNSIEDTELTEEDTNSIMEKLMENQGFASLINNFKAITSA